MYMRTNYKNRVRNPMSRNIKDEELKRKKFKTHFLVRRSYTIIVSPKECQFLINKMKGFLWTFNLKMRNTVSQ